jgi:hypothetical protein
MIETQSEKDARLQAVRSAGRASYVTNRGEFTDGGYARGTEEFDAWEAGWKQAHNVSYVADTSRSTTSNWNSGGFYRASSPAPEPVNQYELLKGRAKSRH